MDPKPLQPFEAYCDHCHQQRPLFLYEPDHGHLGAAMYSCRWCMRDKQPLLCVRCWGAEKELEENDSGINADAETMRQICETNSRSIERREAAAAADAATCEAIAQATGERSA
ncbi:hypothetical protein ACODT3_10575 [Streptomyces sp. 4.24]|uniref:hypothetical protein n=1 Tax=Streptomyces tritrimontium TaxID=3406573 RepID=UPI003BB5F7ED